MVGAQVEQLVEPRPARLVDGRVAPPVEAAQIGPCVEQAEAGRLVPLGRRHVQRGPAVHVGHVDACAESHQRRNTVDQALRGEVAELVGRVVLVGPQLSPRLVERRGQLPRVPVPQSILQRRAAPPIDRRGVRIRRDKHLDARQVALGRSHVQRGARVVVCRVRVGAAPQIEREPAGLALERQRAQLERRRGGAQHQFGALVAQRVGHVEVVGPHGVLQRRVAKRVDGVDVCAGLDERLHGRRPAKGARHVQRSPAVQVTGVGVCAALE
mmetsp:Transcript_16776/g.54619  ORF Transcript_16776/g.54619 Transcript_16776/m.54619 type:complete len:269 (-) Transcript_16776:3460-4266(-)